MVALMDWIGIDSAAGINATIVFVGDDHNHQRDVAGSRRNAVGLFVSLSIALRARCHTAFRCHSPSDPRRPDSELRCRRQIASKWIQDQLSAAVDFRPFAHIRQSALGRSLCHRYKRLGKYPYL